MVALQEAWLGMARHRLRTGLLVFILALSFAQVLLFIGAVEGGRAAIETSLESLGVDVIGVLNPLKISVLGLQVGEAGDRLIDNAAITELQAEMAADVAQIIPMKLGMTRISDDDGHAYSNTLMAVTPGFKHVLAAGLVAGRFLEEGDRYEPGARVNCVLDEALARYFEPADPARCVGRTLHARRGLEQFDAVIVGVMHDPLVLRKHMEAFDSLKKARDLVARRLEFLNLYVPYDLDRDDPTGVLVQVRDLSEVESVGAKLATFFTARGIDPYYHVQKTWVDAVLETVESFAFLLHFFWVVTLCAVVVVTGTVALMSVEERYLEIAIQRVEGATVPDVVVPLLLEGALIALAATPIGFGIAQLVAEQYMVKILEWGLVLPPLARWGTPVLLLLVGVLTYALPARRVARLSPIQVLGDYEE